MTSILEGQPSQNKACSNRNKGHLGSRCANIYIYIAGMLLGCRIVNELLSSKYIYLSNAVRTNSVSVQTHGVQSNDLIDEAKLTVTHQKWHEPMG